MIKFVPALALILAVPSITSAQSADPAPDHNAMNHSTMDHSQMDHGTMDHSTMDHGDAAHGDMDHGQMDHDQMDHSTMDDSDPAAETDGEDEAAPAADPTIG